MEEFVVHIQKNFKEKIEHSRKYYRILWNKFK